MGTTILGTGNISILQKQFDALFSLSMANYTKKLTDNIGASNALLHAIMKSDKYEPTDGGTHIEEPHMYAINSADSYDGYDELGDTPIDGVTNSIWQFRQLSVPIMYSGRELIQNARKLQSLVKTKMTQAEMGFEESFAQHLMWGAGDGALSTPRTSLVNGSLSIEPLFKLVAFDPTASVEVGNINQSTSSWWRNNTKTSTATTFDAFIFEILNMHNTCALGTGGKPDLILVDQITYELVIRAFWTKYQDKGETITNFPFEAKKFMGMTFVMDDKVPDVFSNVKSTTTYGTALFLNSKFFKLRYIEGRNFDMLTDDQGKTFQKPIKGDSRIGHLAWMGACTISNRRKHGVIGKIARTLTVS